MQEFRLIINIVRSIFFASLTLAVLLAALDAFFHLPLSDFLVHKLADIMILCVGAIAGLLAGAHLARRPTPRPKKK